MSRGLPILAFLGTAALALALGSGLAPGGGHAQGDPSAEAPPAPGTRLHFEKTLFVQRTAEGRVFAETRRVEPGESLHRILTREYQIPEEALPAFVRAFRAANPGVDPDRLAAGQMVRVPFKVEEGLPPSAPPAAAAAPPTYTVQPGDNLWRILLDRFGVPREKIQEALAAVARANPGIRDLNRLHVGQRLAIPPLPGAGPAAEGAGPAGPSLPPSYRTALDLLRVLRCQVAEDGETFVPLSRGRTLRLDGRDFPVVSGPAGGKVILDPGSRLSAALVRALREEWGYACVAGVDPDPEVYLGAILPRLGFFELSEGERSIPLGRGTELLALARWTVVPRPQDLWEGSVHLLFSPGSLLDPRLVLAARRAGYAVHPLGPAVLGTGSEPPGSPPALAELPMADPAQGASHLLSLLGVSHRVRPEVECDLGGGVRYRLTPLLTLRFGGLDYAVPPAEPARAEAMLTRAGYFTVPWLPGAAPLNILGDLLALLGVPHSRPTVEAPVGEALRLRVSGILLQEPELAELLYPNRPGSGAPSDGWASRIFLTEAQLPAPGASLLLDQNLLPWLVR